MSIMKRENEQNHNDTHFDYKNAELLHQYINPHARMLGRSRSDLPARKQRQLARAMKRARQMALMPYISR